MQRNQIGIVANVVFMNVLKLRIMIDYTKVSDNEKVIELIKQREEIEKQIREIDDMALVRYELEALQE